VAWPPADPLPLKAFNLPQLLITRPVSSWRSGWRL